MLLLLNFALGPYWQGWLVQGAGARFRCGSKCWCRCRCKIEVQVQVQVQATGLDLCKEIYRMGAFDLFRHSLLALVLCTGWAWRCVQIDALALL